MYNKKIVIVSKFRFIIFLLIVTMLMALLLNNFLEVVFANNNYKDYKEVFIEKGDSVWKIAKEFNTKNEDVRELVYEIKKINNIDNEWIQPGDVIKIPRN